MAYEPTIWETGDIVSSERLNKLENGVVNSGSGSGVKILKFNTNSVYGFMKSADTYYSFDEIKDMLTEDPNQILAYMVNSESTGTYMLAVPVLVPAGTTNNVFHVTPNVDTIYLEFFGHLYSSDMLSLDVYEYTNEGISHDDERSFLYSLTRWTS